MIYLMCFIAGLAVVSMFVLAINLIVPTISRLYNKLGYKVKIVLDIAEAIFTLIMLLIAMTLLGAEALHLIGLI